MPEGMTTGPEMAFLEGFVFQSPCFHKINGVFLRAQRCEESLWVSAHLTGTGSDRTDTELLCLLV